jgi:Tol biopolymer transport system component
VRRLALAVVASTLALVPAAAEGANEAFPGRNGPIVFASDRTSPREPEIYAAALDGGAPRNLTGDEGWDSRPVPSPDGRRIAFHAASGGSSRRGIHVMNVDGSDRRPVVDAGERPSWAPDSRRLAYEDGLGRIAVIDMETRAVRTLVEGNLPSWSPDGRHIGFLRRFQIFVIDAGGGEPRRVAAGLAVSGVAAFEPAWSPDGTQIVFAGGEEDGDGFARSSDIHVVRVSDRVATRLAASRNEKSGPAWSPDGTEIVYSERAGDEPRSELVVITPAGSGRRGLTGPLPLQFDERPVWSPDSASVAFVRGRARTLVQDVFIVRRDGTGLRRVTQPRSSVPAYEAPSWLPDGRTILFARLSDDLDDDLFVTLPGSEGVRRLTDNTVADRDPSWSPDGALIAFVRTLESGPFGRRDQNHELFVMRADGSGVRRLTRYRDEDLAPAWAPDGSRIAFVRRVERSGVVAIYTIRPDGTGLPPARIPLRAGLVARRTQHRVHRRSRHGADPAVPRERRRYTPSPRRSDRGHGSRPPVVAGRPAHRGHGLDPLRRAVRHPRRLRRPARRHRAPQARREHGRLARMVARRPITRNCGRADHRVRPPYRRHARDRAG